MNSQSSELKLSQIVFRNSVFGLTAQALIKMASFAFSILIVRHLGAQTFGQYSAVIAFGVAFSFLGDLGLSPYLVREVARLRELPDGKTRAEQLYGNVLVLRLVLSLLSSGLVIMTAWITGRPLAMISAITLNSVSLLLYGIQGSSDAILAGFERFDISSIAKVASQVIFVALGAVALYLKVGYFGLVAASVLGVGMMTFICWQGVRGLHIHLQKPDIKIWLTLLRGSLPFGVLALALGLSYKFDTVLLNIVRGDVETGYYNAAYNLVFSAVLISNVLNTSLYPSLSRQSISSPHSLPAIYERAFRYLMLVSSPMAVGIWVLAEPIVQLLYAKGYNPVIPVLQIIIWVVPLMFITEFLGYIVLIANQEKKAARSVIISSGFNVLANLILIPRFGYTMAAVMTVLTEMLLAGQYLWIIRKQLPTLTLLNGLFRPFIAALLMGGIVLIIRDQVPLYASFVIGTLTYLGFAFIINAIRLDDIRFFIKMRMSNAIIPD
jgi:O-antigen/teichoic acid export membrane protein